MRKVAYIASVVFASTLILAGWQLQDEPKQYTFNETSKLWVEGTSTVHDFECEVEDFTGVVVSGAGQAAIEGIEQVNVTVPVGEIDCGNGTMDKKMRDALKVSKHPVIRYELTNVRPAPEGGNGTYMLATVGKLSIAGAERAINMEVKGIRTADGKVRFQGSTPILLSEYNIDRPSAAFGTIKTGDEVTVHFDVIAEIGQ